MPISRIEPSVASAGNDSIYGTGFDGNVVIPSGTTVTITSDMHYNNLDVNSGGVLFTNGYRVFVKNTFTVNGHVGMGSVASNVIGETASAIGDGTVKAQTAISYRAGGQGGGSSNPNVPVLPSFLFKNINAMSGGMFADPTLGMLAIGGGSAGTIGSSGATGASGASAILTNGDSWPNKAGAAGTAGSPTGSVNNVANPHKDNIGVPGGKGNTGADGNVTGMTAGLGGAGGTSGLGGAFGMGGGVVCIIAKHIIGSGIIMSTGRSGIVGASGGSGGAGTTGTAGSIGATGSTAPNLAYHVAPTPNHVAPTHNPNHHHGGAIFSDFHAHGVNPHPHGGGSHHHPHHAAEHFGGNKFVAAFHNPAGNGTPVHNPDHTHNSGHYHHTGSRHHPHSNDGHGGMHYYAFSGTAGTHYKGNTAYQHSHPSTTGHFHGRIEHLNAHGDNGGSLNKHHQHPGHTHSHANGHDLGNGANQGGGMQASGGHHHGPHHYSNGVMDLARHSHHANPNTHTAQPNGHWTGGAGGAGGAAAPAQTGSPGASGTSGKRGGAGGGGAVLVVCDTISSATISYNTSAGLLDGGDLNSATNGSAYVLINL